MDLRVHSCITKNLKEKKNEQKVNKNKIKKDNNNLEKYSKKKII